MIVRDTYQRRPWRVRCRCSAAFFTATHNATWHTSTGDDGRSSPDLYTARPRRIPPQTGRRSRPTEFCTPPNRGKPITRTSAAAVVELFGRLPPGPPRSRPPGQRGPSGVRRKPVGERDPCFATNRRSEADQQRTKRLCKSSRRSPGMGDPTGVVLLLPSRRVVEPSFATGPLSPVSRPGRHRLARRCDTWLDVVPRAPTAIDDRRAC